MEKATGINRIGITSFIDMNLVSSHRNDESLKSAEVTEHELSRCLMPYLYSPFFKIKKSTVQGR